MIPQLMQGLSINFAHIGLVSSSFFYPYILLQIPAGFLVDRYGPTKVILLSCSLCTLSCVLFSYAYVEHTAVFARIMMGISCAPAVVITLYFGKLYFPDNQFPLIAGLLEMLGMLGGALGDTVLATLVHFFHWRHAMLVCAIVPLIIMGLILVFYKIEHNGQPKTNQAEIKLRYFPRHLYAILSIRQIWLSSLYACFMFTLITCFAGLWAVPFFSLLYTISTLKAASLSAIIFIGTACGAPSYGILAGKLKNYTILLVGGAFFGGLLMLIIVYIPNIPINIMYGLLFLLGFVSSSYMLSFDIVKNNSPPNTHGCAMGFTNMMCLVLGAPLLQPFIGYILALLKANQTTLSLQSYQIALTPILLSLLAAFMISFSIKSKHPYRDLHVN